MPRGRHCTQGCHTCQPRAFQLSNVCPSKNPKGSRTHSNREKFLPSIHREEIVASFLNWWGPIFIVIGLPAKAIDSLTNVINEVAKAFWHFGQRHLSLTWYLTLGLLAMNILRARTGQRDLSGTSMAQIEGSWAVNVSFSFLARKDLGHLRKTLPFLV